MISGGSKASVTDIVSLGRKKINAGVIRHQPLKMGGTSSLRAAATSNKVYFRGWSVGQ